MTPSSSEEGVKSTETLVAMEVMDKIVYVGANLGMCMAKLKGYFAHMEAEL